MTEQVAQGQALATGMDPDEIDVTNLTSMEDALALWESTHRADEVLGDGFTALADKDKLVGVAFAIPKFKIVQGDFGEFVVVWAITRDGHKLRFSDGSSGIKEQLLRYQELTGQYGGLVCQTGLTRSDYEYEDADGNMRPATTYYIAES
jgi:hypothetical protein